MALSERANWRLANPAYRENEKRRNAAARRALARLKKAHLVEYRILYADECAAEGVLLRPVGRPVNANERRER